MRVAILFALAAGAGAASATVPTGISDDVQWERIKVVPRVSKENCADLAKIVAGTKAAKTMSFPGLTVAQKLEAIQQIPLLNRVNCDKTVHKTFNAVATHLKTVPSQRVALDNDADLKKVLAAVSLFFSPGYPLGYDWTCGTDEQGLPPGATNYDMAKKVAANRVKINGVEMCYYPLVQHVCPMACDSAGLSSGNYFDYTARCKDDDAVLMAAWPGVTAPWAYGNCAAQAGYCNDDNRIPIACPVLCNTAPASCGSVSPGGSTRRRSMEQHAGVAHRPTSLLTSISSLNMTAK